MIGTKESDFWGFEPHVQRVTRQPPRADRKTLTSSEVFEFFAMHVLFPTSAPPAIGDWATDEVMAAFRQAARSGGTMSRDELLKRVSQELGYKRFGSRIEQVLRGHLRAAIRRKIISVDGDNTWLETPSMDSYDHSVLINTLCSVMREGTVYEREEVIRAVANHLGFRRLRDTVEAPIKSAINGAIRQRRLSYEGSGLWKTGEI